MSEIDYQYLKRLLKLKKEEIDLKDFFTSVKLIQQLCSINCSSVYISEVVKRRCLICNDHISHSEKQFCDCFFHEQCLDCFYKIDYENQNQKIFSSKYSDTESQNYKYIECHFCKQNIYPSLDFIFNKLKHQKNQICSHQECRKQIGRQRIEYNCQCDQSEQLIHKECFIIQYIQSNYQLNCQQCKKEMQFSENQLTHLNQTLQYYCEKCNKNNISFDEVIFCNCNKVYCQQCFQGYLQEEPDIQFQDENFQIQCLKNQKNCFITQRQLKQFLKMELGKLFFNNYNEQLNMKAIKKERFIKCPGFYFQDKENEKIEKKSAQKYITMKRQSEFDEDVKKEYEESLKKLKLKKNIIECNNVFQVNFQEDERIFACNKCEYRDCRNDNCKSPHFNLSCEMFDKLKQFKKQNQQNQNDKNAIYKVNYDKQIIIVDQQFYDQLKSNPNNQIELIEEIKNPFFQACNLPFDLFDPKYDRVWDQNKQQSFRGNIKGKNIQYNYPIFKNLFGYGINIQKLYGKQNNMKWLSRDTDEDTHIVGYHGTKSIAAVQGIIANGFQAGAGQAFAGSLCPYTNTKVGVGVYFGASIGVAYGYTTPIKIANQNYRIIFQCRLNSKTVKGANSVGTVNEYYVVNNPIDIKIYRILLINQS
ncbi:hypothetical protein ABPG72_021452 [Tetrahymena utriculariae]